MSKAEKKLNSLISVRLDSKGRLTLPQAIRELIGAKPGDVFYLLPDQNGGLRVAKGENPFDIEDLSEKDWHEGAANNPAFSFLFDLEEDIYTMNDGKPINEK